MKYTTYSKMGNAIAKKEEFKGNSVIAYWQGTGSLADSVYIVKSYNATILKIYGVNTGGGGSIVFDNKYYSPTTSRLQNIIKQALRLSICIKRKLYKIERLKLV